MGVENKIRELECTDGILVGVTVAVYNRKRK
jgi:hypothetical protein